MTTLPNSPISPQTDQKSNLEFLTCDSDQETDKLSNKHLESSVLKLTSHLAQVQFKLDQLIGISNSQDSLDDKVFVDQKIKKEKLQEISNFINQNLSSEIVENENKRLILENDIKKQSPITSKPKLKSTSSSATSKSSPIFTSETVFFKNMECEQILEDLRQAKNSHDEKIYNNSIDEKFLKTSINVNNKKKCNFGIHVSLGRLLIHGMKRNVLSGVNLKNWQKILDIEIDPKLGVVKKCTKRKDAVNFEFETQTTNVEVDPPKCDKNSDKVDIRSNLEKRLSKLNIDINDESNVVTRSIYSDRKGYDSLSNFSPINNVFNNINTTIGEQFYNQNSEESEEQNEQIDAALPEKQPISSIYSAIKFSFDSSPGCMKSVFCKKKPITYNKLDNEPIETVKSIDNCFFQNHHVQNNPKLILSKAWLVLAFYFNLIDGFSFLTNPKFTMLLAFGYKHDSLPIESTFSREYFNILDKHKQENGAFMFTNFTLRIQQKDLISIWLKAILSRLISEGFYESWACCVQMNQEIFNIFN